jgi:LysR family transcriptional regulator, nitrogen assimilation regulatory protein
VSHGLRALLEKALAREKLKLDAMIEVDSYRAQISLMEEGLGYTLLPPSAIRTEVAAKRLEMAAVSPSVSRELILASPIAPPPSIATTTIATLIVSEIQQLSKEGLWKINMTA